MFQGVDLFEVEGAKRGDKLVGYGINLVQVLFTKEELMTGIFPDEHNKSKSPSRKPFDYHRIQVIKQALTAKFGVYSNEIEEKWN